MEKRAFRSQLSLVLLLLFPEFRTVSLNLLRCGDFNHLVDPDTLSWESREMCKLHGLQTALISGRYPHRVFEGKGHVRFINRRQAELTCDFQQPRSIISNVIWHKVTRPLHTDYNLYLKNSLTDGVFNNGNPQNLFNYPQMYVVNRPGGSSLFIPYVSEADFGIYRCFATRYAIPFTYKYPQLMTVYQDVEFYPKHQQYVK
ncbi:uncharacterized protein LOC124167067 [Ischnura elegans]|uniref:uncharacterized protein LOC124167067 n=1 Tax=Ischnura elegans TaxID=197161 RepID=UPI001ED86831|nr:uncharacterized protein LOC124167067 [Ischnura elegans]